MLLIVMIMSVSWAQNRGGARTDEFFETTEEFLDSGADIDGVFVDPDDSYENADGMTWLMYVAALNYSASAQLLIDAGADLEAGDNDDWTALMWATWGASVETLEVLLEAGADPDAVDVWGCTALMHVSTCYDDDYAEEYVEIAQLLIDYGADVNISDDEGYTALDYAADDDIFDIVDLLEDAGAY